MDVTSTTSVTNTSSSDFVSNPDAELTSDDFLKLFMTELQYQDPTEPMKTEDMLNQTSQLTQLQTNTDLKNSLDNLTTNMNMSTQFSSISMIGKMADTGMDGFSVTDASHLSKDIPFDLYFDDSYKDATVKITDKNGDVVKSFPLENGDKGTQSFTWDGKDDNGNPVSDGVYSVTADYTTTNDESKTTKMGTYPVESVKFDSGEAYVKLGNNYMPLSSVKEVY